MKAYLFGWNPVKWEWRELDDDIQKLKTTGKLEDNWSVISHKSIQPGDRAYMIRLGVEPRGIFASGFIASAPYPAYRNGRHYYRITIALDVLLNPVKESILSMDILKTGNLAEQNWTPQASGISIRPQIVDELEGVWLNFLGTKDEFNL
ncbi:hypothetical protein KXD93_29640 [Mucilaginibacter sp. BJC16-A38]|uniref:hypothetical protein n=1 Tax=Mucilaginibacter phenanthrenivorans TaxID=1234842 RepID=UPI002157E605|nr:hypothetical protein [Mucilaginibacter phenanthrenivorans]MCR8561855.1 hypothetical protein [Mucilaginibacter phenanthrenivorans]